MKPDDPKHDNPELTAIFNAAIPQVAQILAEFDKRHPVVASYNAFFKKKKLIDRHREAGDWMNSLGLVSTPELEVVLADPLIRLLKHEALAEIPESERNRRIMAVGSTLLQLLAVQHALGEQLNLNGDILNDLELEEVESGVGDGRAALTAMFDAIPLASSRSEELVAHMTKFNHSHAFYDPEFRPPTFRRARASSKPSTPAILVALKRKGDKEIELPPTKKSTGNRSSSKPKRKAASPAKKPVPATKAKKRRSRWPGWVEVDSDDNEIPPSP